jgi:hypothetical protein
MAVPRVLRGELGTSDEEGLCGRIVRGATLVWRALGSIAGGEVISADEY